MRRIVCFENEIGRGIWKDFGLNEANAGRMLIRLSNDNVTMIK